MPTSFPPEVFAQILRAVNEPELLTYAIQPEDMLARCTLVCKALRVLATEELYRTVCLQIAQDPWRELKRKRRILEETLLSNKHARDSVRCLSIEFVEEDWPNPFSAPPLEWSQLSRLVGVFFACCSQLDFLHLDNSNNDDTYRLIKFAAGSKPNLRRVELWGAYDSPPSADIVVALRSLVALKSILIYHDALDYTVAGPVPWDLNYLSLSAAAYSSFSEWAEPGSPSLQHVYIDLDAGFWELPHPRFSTFLNLARLELVVLSHDPLDLLRLLPILEGCTQVQHLSITWEGSFAHCSIQTDDHGFFLARLPTSLRILDLIAPGREALLHSDCVAAVKNGWAPNCTIRVGDEWWSARERREWKELMDERWEATRSSAAMAVGRDRRGSSHRS